MVWDDDGFQDMCWTQMAVTMYMIWHARVSGNSLVFFWNENTYSGFDVGVFDVIFVRLESFCFLAFVLVSL